MPYIDRGKAFDVLTEYYHHKTLIQKESLKEALSRVPTADVVEVVRCKDCHFGIRYFDVRKEGTDSWVECTNPDGLHRDASDDEYCSASIRRKADGKGTEDA